MDLTPTVQVKATLRMALGDIHGKVTVKIESVPTAV
jgi:hypothetical protein